MKYTQQVSNYIIPMTFIGLLFFMIGFALGINVILVPFLEQLFELSSTSSYLILAATFSAFVFFGYPAGLIIKKIGYKKTIILSFLLFAIGFSLFIPSALYASFSFFLLASFVCGIANTTLQAAVNPYITIIGPIETTAVRMSIMAIANKVAWAVAPVFLAIFIDLENPGLEQLYLPFYIIIAIFILLGILSWITPLPEIKAVGEDDDGVMECPYAANKSSIWQFPHLILGAVALLFYVGVETIALATIVDYAKKLNFANPETYEAYTSIAMVVGYLLGIVLIPKYFTQVKAMKICAFIGVIASLAIVMLPIHYSIWGIAILGLANSQIWGAMWGMAMADLGKFTKTGASILVMAIVGGAILPLMRAGFDDMIGSFQQSYWICTPIYLFLLYYAYFGYKIRIK